ncbi:MAG: hypothetical protein JKY61_05450 [Planctomycetes bacterium]|nr:hypothetical protein [Planctomycetota bacterium]
MKIKTMAIERMPEDNPTRPILAIDGLGHLNDSALHPDVRGDVQNKPRGQSIDIHGLSSTFRR